MYLLEFMFNIEFNQALRLPRLVPLMRLTLVHGENHAFLVGRGVAVFICCCLSGLEVLFLVG